MRRKKEGICEGGDGILYCGLCDICHTKGSESRKKGITGTGRIAAFFSPAVKRG